MSRESPLRYAARHLSPRAVFPASLAIFARFERCLAFIYQHGFDL